jgi:thioesterase domain-containing protein/aryl carrier-like protein
MLPAHILFVSEMPVNENGKLDIAKLPQPTAPRSDAKVRGSCTPAEWQLLRMCGELLPIQPPRVQDNLFDAGLHSLLAARLAARIERAFGKRISLSRIFELPTIERLAAFLEDGSAPVERLAISPLQPHGSLAPLFFLGGGPYLWPLAKRLGRPVLGLTEQTGLPDLTLEAFAAQHVQTLRHVRPHGPYALAGWCASGNAAYAVAQQLRAEGEEVALLILLDSINYAAWHAPSRPARIRRWIRRHAESLRFHCRQFSLQPAGARAAYLRNRVEAIRQRLNGLAWGAMYATQQRLGVDRTIVHSESQRSIFAARRYRPQPYAGRVLLVRQTERPASEAESDLGWKIVAAGNLEIESVMGGHHSMFQEPSVETLAELLRSRLADALRDR